MILRKMYFWKVSFIFLIVSVLVAWLSWKISSNFSNSNLQIEPYSQPEFAEQLAYRPCPEPHPTRPHAAELSKEEDEEKVNSVDEAIVEVHIELMLLSEQGFVDGNGLHFITTRAFQNFIKHSSFSDHFFLQKNVLHRGCLNQTFRKLQKARKKYR